MIISIFTPHGGCPERCHFCDQKVSGGTPIKAQEIVRTIEEHLKTQAQADELAFYGGTFTAMPRLRQKAYLLSVLPYLKTGKIKAIRISTRPDCIDADWVAELHSSFCLRTVELGVQSFDPKVLQSLGRTHSNENVEYATKVLKNLRIKLGYHFLIGSPNEEKQHDEQMLKRSLELKPDFVRIHPLLVLKNTPLEKQYLSGKFKPIDLEQAIQRCADLVQKFEANGIKVIRLGLQPNELLDQSIVAGAYHPAFGDLVRGRILRQHYEAKIKAQLEQMPPGGLLDKNVRVSVPKRELGTFYGPSRSNLEWLKHRFNLPSISVDMVEDRCEKP